MAQQSQTLCLEPISEIFGPLLERLPHHVDVRTENRKDHNPANQTQAAAIGVSRPHHGPGVSEDEQWQQSEWDEDGLKMASPA
eukprot:CAMPEP_0115679636 /NCGR_PEP_ID=MMETSP0272-20121206/56381_1 /TAXON_ID=71861 /ORGANISM="Scrippsiella trochoidea, Strain CCMP3099" /LENGTH=82 /DNA_ID=CAMNT_0003118867 /DNA_START=51 /DNA_END=300 /DNA_ORIENTATION=-